MSRREAEVRLINLLSSYRNFASKNTEEFGEKHSYGASENLALGVAFTILLIAMAVTITENLIDYYGPVVTVGGLTISVAAVRRRGGCFLGWLAAVSAIGGLAYVLPWTDQVYLPKIFGLTTSIVAVMLASPGSFGPPVRRAARRIGNAADGNTTVGFRGGPGGVCE